jgi:spore coat protein A, manganese oxidase
MPGDPLPRTSPRARPARRRRNGKRPPPWERGLEDTWRLDPGERVVVAARFVDHTGPFMVHCHMLDHEDHGMMATFRVTR